MAIVRRAAADWNSGYGVFGDIYQNDTLSREISIKDSVAAAIEPAKIPDGSGVTTKDAPVNYCNVIWRAKIQVVAANLNLADTFNTQSAKRKYGRYLYKAEDYVTHEHFLSYDNQMSALGAFAFGYGDVQSKDDIPCDEPPIDIAGPTFLQPITSGVLIEFSPYSGFQGRAVSRPIFTTATTTPADKIVFIPELCLQSYIIGITFTFVQQGLELEAYIRRGLPPITLL